MHVRQGAGPCAAAGQGPGRLSRGQALQALWYRYHRLGAARPMPCAHRRASPVTTVEESPSAMTQMIFISLPVARLPVSIAFYEALGFRLNPQFSDEGGACMVWSDAIHVMLLSHAKWRTFTQRPFPAAGSAGHMLTLALESREAVDRMNEAAAAHGGQADVNPPEDMGFMITRDLADPDGHMWAALWMDPAAMPKADAP